MRILHTSDLHINSPLTSHLAGDAALLRRREINGSLHRIINAARENFASTVIIAGDLFDGARVSGRELDSVISAIIEAADISFYYLPGNHEKDALRASGKALPENLFIFGEEWTYFDTGAAVIAGRTLTEDGMFESLALSPERKNIVVLHGEARTKSDVGGIIGIKEAKDKNISYLALGHYHSYSHFPIDSLGVAVYCGTPEGRGFDECGECGAVIIDTDMPYPYHRFIKTATRTLHSLEINVDGSKTSSHIERALMSAAEGIPSSDIVRAALVGRVDRGLWIDTVGLCKSAMGRFFYSELKDETGISINTEDFEYDTTLRGELVRTVMADTALTDREKERIIACALAALDGEAYFGE